MMQGAPKSSKILFMNMKLALFLNLNYEFLVFNVEDFKGFNEALTILV